MPAAIFRHVAKVPPHQSTRSDWTPAFLRASLERNVREAEKLLQLSLPAEWPEGHTDLLSLRLKQLEAEPALQPWLLRAMALRATGVMVGTIGFHAAPGTDYLRPARPVAPR